MPPTPQISNFGDLWGGGRRCVINNLINMQFYAILDPYALPEMHVWDKVDECYHPQTAYIAQMLVQKGMPEEIIWIILNVWNANEVLAWRWRRTVTFVRQVFRGNVEVDFVLDAMQANNFNDIGVVWKKKQEILLDKSKTRAQRDVAIDELMQVVNYLTEGQVTMIQYHLHCCDPMSDNPPWFPSYAIQCAWVPQSTLP
jgi:hypothetical protein